MFAACRSFAAGVAASLLLASGVAQAQTRVALVIGNSAYQSAAPLPNPVRDARAVADLFKSAGFDVVHARNDVSNLEFRRAAREFFEVAQHADIAVIYFAGHGLEFRGENYLLPIDAKLATDQDVEDEAVPLDRLIRAIEPASRLRLIILDACRDNPLMRTMRRTAAVRAVARGLAKVEPATGNTLIAYAARAGSVAEDGDDGHSPFTAALLKHIAQPGLDVHMALRRVRDDVLKSTGNRQEPFVYGSLGGEEIPLVPAPQAKVAPATDSNAARHEYELAQRVGGRAALESFLAAHQSGFYADVARAEIGRLIENEKAAAVEREKQARLEQERLAQAERERLERDRLAGERIARERAEQETASANSTAAVQTAMLPPSGEPSSAPATPPRSLSGAALVREIEQELKRVGCYGGRIDGEWASATTKSSVRKFAKHASLSSAPHEPSMEFLDLVRGKPQRVCPLECGPREVEANGRCVAKTCPRGLVLSDKGDCEKPRERVRTASRPPSAPSSPSPVQAATPPAVGGFGGISMDPRGRRGRWGASRVTQGGQVTCGPRGCQTVPKGCIAVRGEGGGGMGGRIFCP